MVGKEVRSRGWEGGEVFGGKGGEAREVGKGRRGQDGVGGRQADLESWWTLDFTLS